MSLVSEAVEPSTVTGGDLSDSVAVLAENHNNGKFTRLVPIPEADFNKTIRKLRTAALAAGFGVRIENRTVADGNVVAVVSLATPQTRTRKPKTEGAEAVTNGQEAAAEGMPAESPESPAEKAKGK